MSRSEGLDRWQRRHPAAAIPLATIYKYADDSGPYLSALLTYYAFISILPLLLLSSTILSVVLVGDPELQQRLLNSALGQFPLIGDQLQAPEALGGGVAGIVIGLLGATYGALGVAQALQHAGNTVWHVPRNKRPNPFLGRLRSVALIATAGLGMLVIVIGSAVVHALVRENTLGRLLTYAVGAVVAALVLLVAFRLATRKRLGIRVLLPGAVGAAVLLQLLQAFTYLYVGGVIRPASDTNAVFATVLGILAYLYLASIVVVIALEVNVVLAERLWPRALLTPFTDNVSLTEADRQAYTLQAQAQRTKGFQEIDVSFEDRPET